MRALRMCVQYIALSFILARWELGSNKSRDPPGFAFEENSQEM